MLSMAIGEKFFEINGIQFIYFSNHKIKSLFFDIIGELMIDFVSQTFIPVTLLKICVEFQHK
jgi:hypothetical protein